MGQQRELPPQARRLLPIMLVALLGLSLFRLGRPAPTDGPPSTHFDGRTMGTTYSVQVVGELAEAERTRVAEAIGRELSAITASMSTYVPGSELSRFNREAQPGVPFPVSEPLREVLSIALDVGRRSGGALDPTVGPAVDAWGFGPGDRSAPDATARAALLAHIGLSHLRLSPAGLARDDAAVGCDLSAIAKGYAVDRVADALAALGHASFLVEVGGELEGRGQRPDGQPWRVGVEKPVPGRRAVETVVPLTDMGMATSGDYRNYFEDKGERRSHLLDPRTAAPVTHMLASVTVLHPDTARADAWATALSVLGPDEGPAVAEREGISAFFVVRTGEEGFRSKQTRRFTQLVGRAPEPPGTQSGRERAGDTTTEL